MKPTRKKPKKQGPIEQGPTKQTREQIIAESIEDAMRPYLGVLPPEALQTMRDILEDTMATHPVATQALDELVGQPVPDRSGTRVREENGGQDGDQGDPS
jgi:hypothetical protein